MTVFIKQKQMENLFFNNSIDLFFTLKMGNYLQNLKGYI
ncbi:hypothetical protein LEP1GSC024_0539 [Leptospira noguchii str. 2001034031]|uniref:Uncharacterized protein n=1 Tax=Leptospira noguchii str. 2001034031 TaxID=1193053 RepID=M6YMK7_9LEPT|nr:hypothetical protein LEP1GSC024_0539 [Leptospira noguchii str. 2001034031]